MPKNSPKSPDINIKRETKTRKDRPKPNPLIVYERLVRLERWTKFGHASLEPGKREKKKYCNFNEGGPAHSKTRYLIDYTRDRKSRWRSSPPSVGNKSWIEQSNYSLEVASALPETSNRIWYSSEGL